MKKLIDLGWCMGKLDMSQNSLVIFSPEDPDTIFKPANSVMVYGVSNLIALRNLLNETYPEEEETP